jgi:hypothetical protein
MKSYIQENSTDAQTAFKQYKLFDKPVYVLQPLDDTVSLEAVLSSIAEKIPSALTKNFENMYVGQFADFSKNGKHFNAMYKDGTIYVSNEQDDEADMADDIVHEIAHSLERSNYDDIYADQALENEFLGKRKHLHHLIPANQRANMVHFLNPDYDESFDMYLYKDLGYPLLRGLTSELFYSPYAITALKEYWANGFEHYFLGDRGKLKDISPVLFNKIKHLTAVKKEENNEY